MTTFHYNMSVYIVCLYLYVYISLFPFMQIDAL